MKSLVLAFVFITNISQAAFIHSATYNSTTDKVDLDLTYGGCRLDTFEVKFSDLCLESHPMQMNAVVDDSQDVCRGLIREKLSVDLTGMASCRPGILNISTKSSGKRVSVLVPEKGDEVIVGIKVTREVQPIRVDSVVVRTVGGHGFPSQQVLVSSTFGNSCEVPTTKELVRLVKGSSNFQSLSITLASESQKICPAVYKPVTVTIDVGTFTKPNDGLFSKISVNGKVAPR